MEKKEEQIINEIEEKIQQKKKIPIDVQEKINKRIFENLLIAVGIIFFYIFLICGFHNIQKAIYVKDLKVFSVFLAVLSIGIFEYSYKNENTKTCIWGIETLILAIVTLFSIYICIMQEQKFIIYLSLFSYIISIYYIAKNIIIYKKMQKEYIKSLSDINEIVKKEKPVKKEKTERKRK